MISKRNRQILLFFLTDKNKKNWFQIIKEFTTLYLSNKEVPVNWLFRSYDATIFGQIAPL